MKRFITMMVIAIAGISAAFADSLTYTVEPATGTTIKAGTTIYIHFLKPDGTALDSDGVDYTGSPNPTITGADGSQELTASLSGNYQTLFFTIPETMVAGEYTISIEEGKFYEYNHSSNVSPAISLTYTVTNDVVFPTYDLTPLAVNPADKSEVAKGDKVTLSFQGAVTLEEDAYAVASTVEGKITCLPLSVTSSEVSFTMDVDDNTETVYYVTISQGQIGNGDNHFNQEIKLQYTVKEGVEAAQTLSYTVDPASGSTIQAGESFTITFAAEDYDEYSGVEATDGNFNLTIKGADNNTAAELIGSQTGDFTGVKYTVPESLAEGTYTIDIPAGKFYAYGAPDIVSPAITLTYTISGNTTAIESIQNSACRNSLPVFDLSGRRVNMRRTSSGVYIVNGKKIIVR